MYKTIQSSKKKNQSKKNIVDELLDLRNQIAAEKHLPQTTIRDWEHQIEKITEQVEAG